MAEERLGASFSIDVSQLQAGLKTANKMIRESESEFKAAAAGMDDWTKSEDGLTAKLNSLNKIADAQRAKVDALTKSYEAEIKNGLDPASDRAIQLRTQLNNEQAALKKTEADINSNTTALKNLGKESEESGGKMEKLGEIGKKVGQVMAASLAAIGAAAVAAGKKIWDMANEVAEAGNEIDKNSQKIGISAEAYQEWDYVFERAGADVDNLKTGMKTLSGVIADAGNGSASAAQKLNMVGLSLEDLNGKSQEEQLSLVIQKLQQMGPSAERTAAAADLLGKSSVDMAAVLNMSAEETQALIDEAHEYGMVMSNEAVKASANFEDSLTKLKGTVNGVKNNLIGNLLPAFSQVIDGFSDLVAGNEGAGDRISEGVKSLISNVTSMIPQAVSLISSVASAAAESAPEIIRALATGILDAIPQLLPVVGSIAEDLVDVLINDVLPQLVECILRMTPQLISTISSLISRLLTSLGSALPRILDQIISLLPQINDSILAATPQLLEAAITFLMSIIQAIPVIVDRLLSELPQIIDSILSMLLDENNLQMIVDGAISLFMAILDAIPQICKSLLQNLPQIIMSIVSGLIRGIPELIKAGGQLLAGLFKGLLDPQRIWNAVKDLFNGIIGGLKSLFGIHSPSKVMENLIGKNLALGIGEGFDKNIGKVNAEIADALQLGNIGMNVNGINGIGGGKQVVVNQSITYSQSHTRYELYKNRQETAAAVRLALQGV